MFLRSMFLLLLTTSGALASERYVITTYNQPEPQGQFILCTDSGHFGVDCGIFSVVNNKPQLLLSTHVKNENIKTFTEMISDFLSYIKDNYGITIKNACFAGPGVPSAQQDYLKHMRLPYVIDTKEIIATTDLTTAIIVNDFLAMSYGIDFMDRDRISVLYDAQPEPHGRRAIIGAGQGLGTVTMMWDECKQAYISLPSEAGTGNFPPFDQFEFDLMIAMKKVRNFVTTHWAFFVSLPAIEYMYQILQDMNYQNCSTEKSNLDAMTILASAQSDTCCNKVADLFYKFYARFVYNFVWTTLPFGGIYLVGETATKHPEMLSSIFLPEYFNCVETKRPNLQRVPVYIINDDIQLGLYGTAQYFLTEKKELFGESSFVGNLSQKISGFWSVIKEKVFS